MIVLETSRFILRQLTLDDLAAVIALYSDPIAMLHKGGARSAEQTMRPLTGSIEEYRTLGYCFWAVMHRQHHQFIGVCGLLARRDVNGQAEVEVAYTLAQAYWH